MGDDPHSHVLIEAFEASKEGLKVHVFLPKWVGEVDPEAELLALLQFPPIGSLEVTCLEPSRCVCLAPPKACHFGVEQLCTGSLVYVCLGGRSRCLTTRPPLADLQAVPATSAIASLKALFSCVGAEAGQPPQGPHRAVMAAAVQPPGAPVVSAPGPAAAEKNIDTWSSMEALAPSLRWSGRSPPPPAAWATDLKEEQRRPHGYSPVTSLS